MVEMTMDEDVACRRVAMVLAGSSGVEGGWGGKGRNLPVGSSFDDYVSFG
ncbi:Hypothetical predicted protein [Olea europaea subsp. europaea]|uniref:Uncharacterized protein n=1 Tax=Olea europaea subsp. europaea TaxID=158383 RepID=A0A8S0RR42_OLEEU|nr:Hypothetical predicted protein [Olea europaea subsp. europaea]